MLCAHGASFTMLTMTRAASGSASIIRSSPRKRGPQLLDSRFRGNERSIGLRLARNDDQLLPIPDA